MEELLAQKKIAEQKLAEKVRWMEEEVSRIRERLNREQDRKVEAEKNRIVYSFLEVADHLERAATAASDPAANVPSILDGLRLIHAVLLSRLAQHGVKPLAPLGERFDPQVCEAVTLGPVSDPELDQAVIEVLETGYLVGDQVLRPAKVRVGAYQSGD